jgi:hypothetical protein
MKYFSDFSISYRRGSLSMAGVSGLNATKANRNCMYGKADWISTASGSERASC